MENTSCPSCMEAVGFDAPLGVLGFRGKYYCIECIESILENLDDKLERIKTIVVRHQFEAHEGIDEITDIVWEDK